MDLLSKDQLSLLKTAAPYALARRDLLTFCQLVDRSYTTPPHVRLLADYLTRAANYEVRRLIIVMPPRHGKSELVSGKFPAWCLGRDPDCTIILTSYGSELAEKYSGQVRDTIKYNPAYAKVFPNVTLDPGQQSRARWALLGHTGGMLAVGLEGGVTGFGAKIFIIDDPVKGYEEAISPSQREKAFQWFLTCARTRLAPDGVVIVIQTRWHEDDLAGRLMNMEEEGFVVLHLPAESLGLDVSRLEDMPAWAVHAIPDPLGRPYGEPLWPEQFNKEFLDKAKKGGDGTIRYQYQALYQGLPSAPLGEKFHREKFEYITKIELDALEMKRVAAARSWDLAFSEQAKADHTAGLKASLWTNEKNQAMLVLEDVACWQEEWDVSAEWIVEKSLADGEEYGLLVEAVASQNMAFKSLCKDPRLWKHTKQSCVPDKDKFSRAQYAIRLVSLGMVRILRANASSPPPWEKPFLDELGVFPNGAQDNRVDAFTQLVNTWASKIDTVLMGLTVHKPESRKQRPWVFRDEQLEGPPAQDRLGWRERPFEPEVVDTRMSKMTLPEGM